MVAHERFLDQRILSALDTDTFDLFVCGDYREIFILASHHDKSAVADISDAVLAVHDIYRQAFFPIFFKDRERRERMVESARRASDDHYLVGTSLYCHVDRDLRIGNVLLCGKLEDLVDVAGHVAKRIEVADKNIYMCAHKLSVLISRVGGDNEVVSLGLFLYVLVEYLSACKNICFHK